VSTTPITPGQPEIPLTPAMRTAYVELYNAHETAIENTADPALIASLMESQQAVAKIIALDDEAIIKQDSASFGAVLSQIGVANKALTNLLAQIAKVAGDIAKYAAIAGAISKVLSMVPGI
jgi:hypothetical protein